MNGRYVLSLVLLWAVISAAEGLDTELVEAAKRGDSGAVADLLVGGADPDATDWSGGSALMWAAKRGHVLAVKELLAKGAAPDQPGPMGRTPLMLAAAGGNTLVMLHLLHAGVEADRADSTGMTALMIAAEQGQEDAVKTMLRDSEADSLIVAPDGKTAAMIAASRGHRWEELIEGPLIHFGPGPPPGTVRMPSEISSQPVLLKQPLPAYPPEVPKGVGGTVYVTFGVDVTGKVRDVVVLKGPDQFRKAAVDAVKKWEFEAAIEDGRPVTRHLTVPIHFKPR